MLYVYVFQNKYHTEYSQIQRDIFYDFTQRPAANKYEAGGFTKSIFRYSFTHVFTQNLSFMNL